jgi:hypothetical protein
MRQMISGVFAALAVVAASAAPAKACGFTACEQTYASAYGYSGCATGCSNGWEYERLAEPTTQYYFVNQGPTYTGPGAFAPYPAYQEGAVSGWNGYHARPYHYGYHAGRYAVTHYYGGSQRWHHGYPRQSYRYGYAPRVHHGLRYGYMPRHYYYGHPVLRRYY